MSKVLDAVIDYSAETICDEIDISESESQEFLNFLEAQQSFLDTGLGAFHTDNHSNW